MFRRYPFKRLRPIGVALISLLIGLCAFVCLNHYLQWFVSATVFKLFLGTLLLLVFVPLFLIGLVYQETVYLRANYADYHEEPWSFYWAMACHVIFIAVAVCFYVDAATGVNPLSWLKSLSRW